MKRSEFIEKVWNRVQPDYDKYFLKENVKNLVILFEELGMAPPEVAEDVQTQVIDSRTGQVINVENSKVFVRKWEDEA